MIVSPITRPPTVSTTGGPPCCRVTRAMLAVRLYLRYGLSYRDLEELLAERGIAVDHVTIYRWVQRFTPELIGRPALSARRRGPLVRGRDVPEGRRAVGYLYRAIDQHGQVIDVLASPKRDLAATRRFFAQALTAARRPTEVTTDRAPAYPGSSTRPCPRPAT